jgi:hypothetical protein
MGGVGDWDDQRPDDVGPVRDPGAFLGATTTPRRGPMVGKRRSDGYIHSVRNRCQNVLGAPDGERYARRG